MSQVLKPLSRRQFLKLSGAAAGAIAIGSTHLSGAQDAKVTFKVASIGLGGQGTSRLKEALACGMQVVALCDADSKQISKARATAAAQLEPARAYSDHHKLLDSEKDLDGVIIATPDHWHARICEAALAAGKHVFCEKPLTRTLGEARQLRERSRTAKPITQMGNQGSASNSMRRGIELVQAGAIGAVREVHVWVPRSSSFRPGQSAPVGADQVPAGLDWERWVGPSPFHAYKRGIYHPLAWRAWYDFGGGSIADWGCHGLNFPFRALQLEAPAEVEADIQGKPSDSYPQGVRVRYQFPARQALPAVTLWWYDGGRTPSQELVPKTLLDYFGAMPDGGVLALGEKGFTFGAPHPGAEFIRLKEEKGLSSITKHEATAGIAQSLPRVKGHMQEWLDCCQAGKPTFSNFDLAGQLTEICLVGVLAVRLGKKLEWDSAALKARNAPEADPLIHVKYRGGWD